jgi:hypothetical protein
VDFRSIPVVAHTAPVLPLLKVAAHDRGVQTECDGDANGVNKARPPRLSAAAPTALALLTGGTLLPPPPLPARPDGQSSAVSAPAAAASAVAPPAPAPLWVDHSHVTAALRGQLGRQLPRDGATAALLFTACAGASTAAAESPLSSSASQPESPHASTESVGVVSGSASANHHMFSSAGSVTTRVWGADGTPLLLAAVFEPSSSAAATTGTAALADTSPPSPLALGSPQLLLSPPRGRQPAPPRRRRSLSVALSRVRTALLASVGTADGDSGGDRARRLPSSTQSLSPAPTTATTTATAAATEVPLTALDAAPNRAGISLAAQVERQTRTNASEPPPHTQFSSPAPSPPRASQLISAAATISNCAVQDGGSGGSSSALERSTASTTAAAAAAPPSPPPSPAPPAGRLHLRRSRASPAETAAVQAQLLLSYQQREAERVRQQLAPVRGSTEQGSSWRSSLSLSGRSAHSTTAR